MKVDIETVLEIAEADDNQGICLACGEVAYCVEPDAQGYPCERCNKRKVVGAELALIMCG